MVSYEVFQCYGNFCSYNCAKRYLRPYSEDDAASSQCLSDMCMADTKAERMQLLELLCHLETGSSIFSPIKSAPSRLSLSMFGGTKSIEEFRANFSKNETLHIFRGPMVPISYQMEEEHGRLGSTLTAKQRVSLDTLKIEQAFNDLASKCITGTKLKKLLRT